METNPRAAFERLFGEPGTREERLARIAKKRSILDSISEEAGGLERGLGPRDKSRLGDYLDNIREIERRIQQAEAHGQTEATSLDAPIGVPEQFADHVGLMYDLVAAAWQADITRVFTFMMSRELSQRTFPQIGVNEQHHTISHHQNDKEKMAKCVQINTYYAELYSKFLARLKATEDGDGSLFDHSLLFYGAGMGDSNSHASDPLPIVVAGGGVGRGHRHVVIAGRTPVGNLWSTVAVKYGTTIEHFGDGTGPVEGLL
jgi:hypothetical protein